LADGGLECRWGGVRSEEVYGKLLDFARSQPLDPDVEDYLIHNTTGTQAQEI